MSTKIIVPDANVFTKLLHPEHDSDEAKVFFKTCAKTNTRLVVPELFKYEIAEVTRHKEGPLAKTLDLFDAHIKAILTVSSPDRETWLLAEEIANEGHEKSGCPTIYDSIYHSLAIQLDGVFLTADKKHHAKAKDYGHIKLLKEWESIFQGG
ncbi:MAG: type II toxin-antitoxin system VapC family toxin [Gammaproteobacteria bacterium]|nr:type II toxin-antitoxin system VapC family toxin [Gammaproteobacteria bacterium]